MFGPCVLGGQVKLVELDISPSFCPRLTLEIWFRLNSYAGRGADEGPAAAGDGEDAPVRQLPARPGPPS